MKPIAFDAAVTAAIAVVIGSIYFLAVFFGRPFFFTATVGSTFFFALGRSLGFKSYSVGIKSLPIL
jgi:hypothetical protein